MYLLTKHLLFPGERPLGRRKQIDQVHCLSVGAAGVEKKELWRDPLGSMLGNPLAEVLGIELLEEQGMCVCVWMYVLTFICSPLVATFWSLTFNLHHAQEWNCTDHTEDESSVQEDRADGRGRRGVG